MPILLSDAAKFYKDLPHQKEAFKYLQSIVTTDELNKFATIYRTAPETPVPVKVVAKPSVVPTSTSPIEKILARISSLNIKLIKPDSNAQESDFCVNIIGVSGINKDFSINGNTPNNFNDLFIILGVNKNGKYKYLQNSIGTTAPGNTYTYKPLNNNGAANVIEDKFYSSIWQIGIHGNGKNAHEALVQTGDKICVTRDKDKNFSSINDGTDCGFFGINFHNGYNAQVNNIGNVSAGCQVIRSVQEHKAAMILVKQDYFYRKNPKHRFSYILLNGQRIFSSTIPTINNESQALEIAKNLIIKWECGGDVSKYLSAYPDPYYSWKIPTIGIGTTIYPNGKKVAAGDVISKNDAYKYLFHFIETKLLSNLRGIKDWSALSANKKAALISFAYNVGAFNKASGFNTISTVLDNKQYDKVKSALLLYVKSNGVTSQGLINRRTDEANLFNT